MGTISEYGQNDFFFPGLEMILIGVQCCLFLVP